MSSPPYSATATATAAAFCSGSLTSQRTNSAPASSATSRPPGSSTSQASTRTPRVVSDCVRARPKPLAAPVIRATRSLTWQPARGVSSRRFRSSPWLGLLLASLLCLLLEPGLLSCYLGGALGLTLLGQAA